MQQPLHPRRLATTVGSAITFPIRAAQEAVSGAPLISGTALGRTQQAATPEPRVPAFPSGMTGTYSPTPQATPQIPAQMVQQPQAQVASVNPRPATAGDLDAFYGRGAYAPQPAAQVAQPTPQRTAIQTPYGTIYATAEQASNLSAAASRTVDQRSTRSPAEQQALLAQMRERGAAIGQRLAGQQEAFFAQKRAERSELARATGEAAKAGVSPQTIREARRAYTSQQPSSIAGIQQQFASFLTTPSFGPTPMANRTAFVRAPFNIPSTSQQMAARGITPSSYQEQNQFNPFVYNMPTTQFPFRS